MKYSITKRLFISVFALILPLLLLQGCIFFWSRAMVTEEVRTSAENNLEYLQSVLERRMQDVTDASHTILSKSEIGSFYAILAHDRFESISDYYTRVADIRNSLRILKYSNELISEVTLFFPTEGLCIDTNTLLPLDDAFLEDLYTAARTQPTHLLHVDRQLYSVVSQIGVENIERARILLCVQLQTDAIQDILNSYSESRVRSSYLLSDAAEYLLGCTDADAATAQDLAPLLTDAQDGAVLQSRLKIGSAAYEAFVCYSKRLQSGIIQLIPRSLYNHIPRLIGLLIFLLCAATVVVLFSLLRVHSRTVGRPVSCLQSAFHAAGHGDFSVRLPAQEVLEFDQLARGFNVMAEHISQLIDTNYRQTIRLQTAELKRLQAQINPHFLYNSFYFLRHLVSSEEYESAEELCRYLGLYFQYITRSDQNTLTLHEEVRHAVTYLSIQLMRFGDTVEAEIDPLPESMQSLIVPRLIVEPVVENCFKHGLNTTDDTGRIRMRYEEDAETVSVIIENNGNDLTEEALARLKQNLELPADESTSFSGLINTQHRLKLFFGDPACVEVSRSPLGGLMVRLRLKRTPLNDTGKLV